MAGLEDVADDMNATVSEAVATYLMEHYWKKTIGAVAEKAIIPGANNEGALKAVKEKFPEAATSPASISWYRSKLRKERPDDILTDRQARQRNAEDG